MSNVISDLHDAEQLRQELRLFLGVSPPGPNPLVEILSSSQEEGYVLHSIRLVTEDDAIPALLGVPSSIGPFPAVVVFHQHAGQRHIGKSEVFGL